MTLSSFQGGDNENLQVRLSNNQLRLLLGGDLSAGTTPNQEFSFFFLYEYGLI